ncbi:MAG: hypothetical protein DCC43_05920 [Candidatus Brocadia sp.]|jgi:hypothetical protein|uniref:DUF5615 domain-containing protein n=1 Tax=Candidatus Brocadia fulgida TaxID=380242 RepID=A0A0M2UWK7_9BACT|nr:MAG: hypothetical protein BROFUL_01067 [Candidatus Brocadia fulgida]MCC6324711.1 hypothetical protein [Candidatus Brocadia sp.]MCE7910577.1 hypothetical protein [Candidatus Brocadia sp. AMX3]MBV6518124.1 hypothetical protein [Candidatus Brocadia fulgida]MDG5996677.1 hypothetical protein [Candidatus Brocadia sp.]
MALRFFADHCISNVIIKTLQDAGNEVLRLRDYISSDSTDQIVISKAVESDAAKREKRKQERDKDIRH